jgi:hypothetical protein
MTSIPGIDISPLSEEHTSPEFVTRDAEATLATMAEDAYVNRVPVMTGGADKAVLCEFYSRGDCALPETHANARRYLLGSSVRP